MKKYRLSELTAGEIRRLCQRNPIDDEEIVSVCRFIFQAVAEKGDEAVRSFTLQFDGVEIDEFRVGADAINEAVQETAPEVMTALQQAAANIRKFHSAQQIPEKPVETQPGVTCWRASRAISPIGIYVPGGTAVLPSTVLMLGIPARLAGCARIILCVPPDSEGKVSPEVLAAAQIAGIRQIFKVGGAQAIAAMTFGTESIPQVEKIFGPGNRYVQTAKLLATFHGVAIDMVAGPSEVLVIADETASAEFVASDLISQAEHGGDSRVVLVSTSEKLIEDVLGELHKQAAGLPRENYVQASLSEGLALLAESLDEAFDFSNRYAPEHLILNVDDPRQYQGLIQSAGSVFIGPWSPEVAGDYASGTNHTLPTSGMARAYSGVSMDSFVKKITFQELTPEGLRSLAPTLEALARIESLEGHRRAVSIRIEKLDEDESDG